MKKNSLKPLIAKIAAYLFIGLVSVNISQAAVVTFKKSPDGVTFKLDKGLMYIRICKADIIEVKYTIFDALPQKNSLVVDNPFTAKTSFSITESGGMVQIKTSRLVISIDKVTNAITYKDLRGNVITAESSSNKTMRPATIV